VLLTGFDVWLGNTRGTPYSRRTVKGLSTDQPEYWAFSFDDLALVDLPTQVDHVLQATGTSKIGFVGHSQVGVVGYTPALQQSVGTGAAVWWSLLRCQRLFVAGRNHSLGSGCLLFHIT
jgi:predicted alpha/beta hydrolase